MIRQVTFGFLISMMSSCIVCLNFENFRYLYNGIVSCKVVMGKIESNLILNEIVFFSGESPVTTCSGVL